MGLLVLSLLVVIAIWGLRSEKWHKFTVACLWWMLFPILFPYYVRKEGMIRHWWNRILLMLVSPGFLSLYLLAILLYGLSAMVSENWTTEAPCTNYHTAYDIYKATGVEFPEVLPVDSIQHVDYCNHYNRIRFIPKKPLTGKFFRRLDRACEEDSVCWRKNSNEYEYLIYPTDSLDRTNKRVSPYRMVDVDKDGKKETYDWDGSYIRVIVPTKGDTITVEEGWYR